MGIEHDLVQFLARETGLGEIEIFQLTLALLIRGFLRSGFEFVNGVLRGGVPVGFDFRGRGLVGGGTALGGRDRCGPIRIALRMELGVVVVVVLVIARVGTVVGAMRSEDGGCVLYHAHLLLRAPEGDPRRIRGVIGDEEVKDVDGLCYAGGGRTRCWRRRVGLRATLVVLQVERIFDIRISRDERGGLVDGDRFPCLGGFLLIQCSLVLLRLGDTRLWDSGLATVPLIGLPWRGSRRRCLLEGGDSDENTYGMSFVLGSLKMGHAIQTRKAGAATLSSVRIEFLLGQNISTALRDDGHVG